jgi:hypothetical protein
LVCLRDSRSEQSGGVAGGLARAGAGRGVVRWALAQACGVGWPGSGWAARAVGLLRASGS